MSASEDYKSYYKFDYKLDHKLYYKLHDNSGNPALQRSKSNILRMISKQVDLQVLAPGGPASAPASNSAPV